MKPVSVSTLLWEQVHGQAPRGVRAWRFSSVRAAGPDSPMLTSPILAWGKAQVWAREEFAKRYPDVTFATLWVQP